MITGNAVNRLNSATPDQPTAQPEGKEDDLYTGQTHTFRRYGQL